MGAVRQAPVHELEDPDEGARVVAHRDDDHRPRPPARLLVEGGVVAVRGAGRHRVGVVEVHRLAVAGDVAGEARVVDGHRPLGEGEAHGVVLGELEAEPLAVRPLLEEVEAPGLRPREPAGFGEDLLQEAVEVPFGGEGDADLVQGGDALLGLGEPAGEGRGRRPRGGDLGGGREDRREERRRGVGRKGEARQRARPARRPT